VISKPARGGFLIGLNQAQQGSEVTCISYMAEHAISIELSRAQVDRVVREAETDGGLRAMELVVETRALSSPGHPRGTRSNNIRRAS
jgi:hypothetical protein